MYLNLSETGEEKVLAKIEETRFPEEERGKQKTKRGICQNSR